MRVLGIDASTTSTGYSLFEDGKLIDYGVIKSDKKEWRHRVFDMIDNMSDYIESIKPIDRIIMEDVPLKQGTTKTTFMLGVLQGAMLGMAISHGIYIELIGVGTWRSKIGLFDGTKEGKERAEMKRKSIEYVNRFFGLSLIYKSPSSKKNEDDISDAILVAYSQVGVFKEKEKKTIGRKANVKK